jgi:hypothetical protein
VPHSELQASVDEKVVTLELSLSLVTLWADQKLSVGSCWRGKVHKRN